MKWFHYVAATYFFVAPLACPWLLLLGAANLAMAWMCEEQDEDGE